jgi:hypothetical protein
VAEIGPFGGLVPFTGVDLIDAVDHIHLAGHGDAFLVRGW